MPFFCSQPIKSTDILKRSHDVLYISACLFIAWHCVIRKKTKKNPTLPTLKICFYRLLEVFSIDGKIVMSLDRMWHVYTVNYKNICLRLVLHDCWTNFESQKINDYCNFRMRRWQKNPVSIFSMTILKSQKFLISSCWISILITRGIW